MKIQNEELWDYLIVQAHYDQNKNSTVVWGLNGHEVDPVNVQTLNSYTRHLEEQGWHLDTCDDGMLIYKRRQ